VSGVSREAALGRPGRRLRRGALWAQPDFLRLWAGQSVSVAGDQIGALALPLVAVLVLDASATQMGVLTAAGWAPHLLFALGAGLWIDRCRRRRRIMIATDLARAAALATLPLAYWLGALTVEQLIGVAFAVGAFTVVFDIAWATFFMRIVPREDVVEANAKLSASRSLSFVAGPPAAGGLVQALGAPVTLLADAVSFVASALLVGRIQAEEPELPPSGESVRTRLAAGFRFVFGQPAMRAFLGCCATVNLFNLGFNAIVVLFAVRELGLSAAAVGVVMGAGALGGLLGAAIAPAVGRRLGIGPAIVLGSVLFPLPLLLFPLAGGPRPLVLALLFAGEFLAGLGVMIFDIHGNSFMFLVTPEELRPRQVATFRFVNYGVRPIGALAGGALAAAAGLRTALLVTAAGAALGVFWLLGSPLRTLRSVEPTG
jgi:MFS family permease